MKETIEKATEVAVPKTMNALDQTLVDILQTVTATAGATKDFLVEQTPQVIQEILTWYAVYAGIQFIFSVSLFILVIVGYKRMLTRKHAPNWVYDEKEKFHDDPRAMVPIAGLLILLVISIKLINLQWLKIWIAPKLWLIEYASNLVK